MSNISLNLLTMKKGELLSTILFILLIIIGTVSCSDDDSQRTPPSPNSITYSAKSQNIVELKGKVPGQEIQNIPFEEANVYFGKRLQLAQPEKLEFKGDSLSFIKAGGLSLKYKILWKKDELYLYNDITAAWEYCGMKDGQTAFILNTGFYWIKNNSTHGSLSILGQRYSLLSYPELIEYIGGNSLNANNQIVWLKIQYKFQQDSEI